MLPRSLCLVPLAVLLAGPGLPTPVAAEQPAPTKPSVPAEERPAPPKTRLSVEDLYLFDAPRSAALAPDGASVAYVRSFLDRKAGSERFSLWLARGPGKTGALEAGEPDARGPVFSPDGRWIAFLSTRPRPK